jgi:hypothetical protein
LLRAPVEFVATFYGGSEETVTLEETVCINDFFSRVTEFEELKYEQNDTNCCSLAQRSPAKETKKTFLFPKSLNYQGCLDFVKDLSSNLEGKNSKLASTLVKDSESSRPKRLRIAQSPGSITHPKANVIFLTFNSLNFEMQIRLLLLIEELGAHNSHLFQKDL